MSTTIDPFSASSSDTDDANPAAPTNEVLSPEASSHPIPGLETGPREETVCISPSPRVLEALRRI